MDKNDIDKFMEMVDSIRDVVDENMEIINDILGNGDILTLNERQPLTEAQVHDDKVCITAEAPGHFRSIGVGYDDGTLVVQVGGDELKVNVPDDVVVDEVDAEYNNGVLTVKIPRDNGTN